MFNINAQELEKNHLILSTFSITKYQNIKKTIVMIFPSRLSVFSRIRPVDLAQYEYTPSRGTIGTRIVPLRGNIRTHIGPDLQEIYSIVTQVGVYNEI